MVPNVADKWRDIGVQLLDPTINDRVLDVIAADHSRSVERCKCVFEEWLNTKKDASWNQLIEAINTIGLNSLSSQLEKGLEGNVCIYISYIIYVCTINLVIKE